MLRGTDHGTLAKRRQTEQRNIRSRRRVMPQWQQTCLLHLSLYVDVGSNKLWNGKVYHDGTLMRSQSVV